MSRSPLIGRRVRANTQELRRLQQKTRRGGNQATPHVGAIQKVPPRGVGGRITLGG